MIGLKSERMIQKTAEELIGQFSDVIHESSLRKAKFLKFSASDVIRCFHFMEESILMFSIKPKNKDTNLNLLDFKTIELHNLNLEIESAEKVYSKKREYEMYDMICNGCVISDGKLYKKLALLWVDLNN